MNIQFIDEKRKEQRWTVTAFCDQIGIDRSTYYNYLNNPDKMKLSTFDKMAALLKMTKAEQRECLK